MDLVSNPGALITGALIVFLCGLFLGVVFSAYVFVNARKIQLRKEWQERDSNHVR
jgi:hypothetical protein